jgi:1,4-alpha-glucan branching enzyme
VTNGARLFKFYHDLIQFRYAHSAIRSHNIDIVHVHNANRVIAFRRWDDQEELLIVASLNNHPYTHEYVIQNDRIGDHQWHEIFNSDAIVYGGADIGNFGETMISMNGYIHLAIPANGFVVFQRL